MRSLIPFVALLTTAGALSAQSISTDPIVAPGDLRTVTRAGVFANQEVSSLPAGAAILRPTALSAEARAAGAKLGITPNYGPAIAGPDGIANIPRVVGAQFEWAGRAGGPIIATDLATNDVPIALAVAGLTGTGNPMQSPQTYCLTLRGDPGALIIEFKGARLNRAFAGATVAIGDRQRDFEATHEGNSERVVIPGLHPGRGLPVKITLRGFAHGSFTGSSAGSPGTVIPGGFEAALSVQFRRAPQPPRCVVEPDQRGCPRGGVLEGAILSTDAALDPAHAHIALGLRGALPNAIGVTILNRSGELGRFPLTVCPILVNPVVVGVFETDHNGNARNLLPVPPVPGQFKFFIQQVTVKFGGDVGLNIASSNTLAVKCSHPTFTTTAEVAK